MPKTAIIHLPMPLSANRLWRKGQRGRGKKDKRSKSHFYKSPEYQKWINEANGMALTQKLNHVPGPFVIRITCSRKKRRSNSDIDNKSKCVLDWLQSVGVIENDKLDESCTVRWGDVEDGCVVRVRGLS